MLPSRSTVHQSATQSVRLLAVIVLYKELPGDSATFKSLQAAWSDVPGLSLKILLFDNTPEGQQIADLPPGVVYEAAHQNRGLADAYNRAIDLALQGDYDWLLTLDQDTTLPADFLAKLVAAICGPGADPGIGAIVPQIIAEGRMVSPNYFKIEAIPKFYPPGYTGIAPYPTYAFNSAATLRVKTLRDVGGYSPLFWLDNSDAYIFHQLRVHGQRVYIDGSIQVHHEFSMFDIKRRVSLARYKNVVNTGCAFWDLELGPLAGLYHTASLVYRLYKHWKRHDDQAIRDITRAMLWKRIFATRQQRIDQWKQSVIEQMGLGGDSDKPLVRAKVSVCMATYNGEQYVVKQLQSILAQLHPYDEVIVVDDASSDGTRERVESLHDARIRFFPRSTNQGVLKTFEEAIRRATGTIIFFSDQDDLWSADKVDTILQTFRLNPDVMLVASRVEWMDERDAPLPAPHAPAPFHPGFWANLYRNRYQGCTMAFRARLLPKILPFPSRSNLLHDVWIGTRASLSGSKAQFIDRPLVRYRRHGWNVTGSRLPLARQLKVRLSLLLGLAAFSIRRWTGGATKLSREVPPSELPAQRS